MSEGKFNSYVSTLRQKWKEIPLAMGRSDTTQLLEMSDHDLLTLWQSTRLQETTGDGFRIRGWYETLYKDILRGKKVMDLGSGFGGDGVTFAQHGANVTFVDVVESNLAVVRRICSILGVQTVQFHYLETLETLAELDTDYDVIWCMGSLIHAPSDVIQEEVQVVLRHLKPNGRWVELGYPKTRWEREGKLPFDQWGDRTDGGAPWVEWKDLKKIRSTLAPAQVEPLLYFDFHNSDFNWFDLVVKEPQGADAVADAQQITPDMELEQTRIQLQQVQAELQSTKATVDQFHAELYRTQDELRQMRDRFQQAQAELDQAQTQLRYVQAPPQQLQTDFQQIQERSQRQKDQLKDTQEQLKRVQDEAEYWRDRATAMESSKFWQLRQRWFRLKRVLRIPSEEQ
jgi:SAM-dependent methyltransferase